MKPTWIMNTNMGEHSDISTYVQAVKDSGAKVIEVQYIPFSNDMLRLDVDGPVVVYGAVNFITKMYHDGRYATGIFGTPDTFSYKSWAEYYKLVS